MRSRYALGRRRDLRAGNIEGAGFVRGCCFPCSCLCERIGSLLELLGEDRLTLRPAVIGRSIYCDHRVHCCDSIAKRRDLVRMSALSCLAPNGVSPAGADGMGNSPAGSTTTRVAALRTAPGCRIDTSSAATRSRTSIARLMSTRSADVPCPPEARPARPRGYRGRGACPRGSAYQQQPVSVLGKCECVKPARVLASPFAPGARCRASRSLMYWPP